MEDGIYRFSNTNEAESEDKNPQYASASAGKKGRPAPKKSQAGSPRRRKKRGNGSMIPAVLLMLFTIAAMALAVFMFLKYDEEQKKNTELTKQIAGMYTQEQLAEEEAKIGESARTEVLEYIRTTLSAEGTGPLETIRSLFPNEIVLGYRGSYIFVPIDKSVSGNTFTKTDFETDDRGRMRYVGAEQPIKTSFGIDVSAHQGNIDWKKVKEDGVDFAFIRAGFRGWGSTASFNKDEKFEYNIKEAYNNGIAVGVYWVTHALDTADVEQELQYLYEMIDPYKYMISYPVVFDLEQPESEDNRIWNLSKEQMTENAAYFMSSVKEKGYTPMLYGNLTSFAMMVEPSITAQYPIWYAWYNVPLYFPYEFNIWQYSSTGRVDGIGTEVDLNLMVKPF